MTKLAVIRPVAILCSGLMAGLLFGDWAGPSFARAAMSVSAFIEFQQIVHNNYLLVLPAVSTVAAGLPILWLVVLRGRRHDPEFKLVLGAAIAIVTGFTITLVFNIPVNDQLETWNPASPPANARELWRPWETAHIARTIFWTLGFMLETIAATSRPERQHLA